ncbi:MAG: ABC transporter permease subunit [Hyphomicrobiales bacterium]|nr:MAG: ABC transporter permease subunit [Hyphomicrobiales bacterium]
MVPRLSIYGLTFALPLLLWQMLFFLLPLVFLVALSFWSVHSFRLVSDFNPSNWSFMLGRLVFWQAYAVTWALAAAGSLLASVLAFPCAYAIAFKLSDAGRRWAVFLMVIPFFTSYLVRVYSWQAFLSDHGIINGLFGQFGIGPFHLLNTPGAILVGYLTLSLPLVILLQVFSLSYVDRTLIEAAHNLRAGRIRAVFAVVVPSARVGLVIAALFAFILCFGDFVSPVYLGGGNPTTLSILITDTTKSGQQWPRAAVIALTMILTLLAVAFAAVRFAYRGARK